MKKLAFWALLVAVATGGMWIVLSDNPSVELPITYSENGFPLVEVGFEGSRYPLQLSLASKYPLILSSSFLDGVRKSSRGETSLKNIRGVERRAPLYELPEVKLGGCRIKNVLAAAAERDALDNWGTIVWPLDRMGLVLDLPHNKVWGVKNPKALPSLGLDVRKMKAVKCTFGPRGMRFPSHTSAGVLNMEFQTSFNRNVVSNSIWDEKLDGECCLDTPIIIEGNDFGMVNLWPFEITPELDLDGILGVDFLKEHIVYIDSQSQTLYIGDNHGNAISNGELVKIPVEFSYENLPVIDIEISKQKYKVIVDLGSSFELTLPPSLFRPHNLLPLDIINKMNVWGETADADVYVLPECKIGAGEFKNLTLLVEGNLNYDSGILCKKYGEFAGESGLLGRPLLSRTNAYFDFSGKSIWFVNREKNLHKINVRLEECEKIPFKLSKYGIVLEVRNDLGISQLCLDTGATVTCVRAELMDGQDPLRDELGNSCYLSRTFRVGSCDYGEQVFYPLRMLPEWTGDGILGMDFLRQHAFYIDYPNQLIYFQRPKPETKAPPLPREEVKVDFEPEAC